MKFPRLATFQTRFRPAAAVRDLRQVQQRIEKVLDSAGLGKGSPAHLQAALDAMHQGFVAAGAAAAAAAAAAARQGTGAARADAPVIDVVAREVGRENATDGPADRPGTGRFVNDRHTGPAGSRAYQLYLPDRPDATTLPLVVMLHGCTQSPDDFAAGTRMNSLADRDGFIVVYPAQSQNANGSRCWNWFRSQDQARDGGEPALIAGIVRDVASRYPVDRSRIHVAGLSAGGAMAVILGQTYPELFAAIGVHSGLAFGAAHDVPSAFAAMSGEPRAADRPAPSAPFVPTIVFHGDRDSTVSAGNGQEVVAQAIARAARSAPGSPLSETTETEAAPGGQRYTRIVHADAAGRPLVERWVLHGAGHAWSGGSAAGSYTDPSGPNASEAMLRFFKAQQPAAAAKAAATD